MKDKVKKNLSHFCALEELQRSKDMFLLTDIYMCRRQRNNNVSVGYNYVPKRNTADGGTLKFKIFKFTVCVIITTYLSLSVSSSFLSNLSSINSYTGGLIKCQAICDYYIYKCPFLIYDYIYTGSYGIYFRA